jgi:hypothetical protein
MILENELQKRIKKTNLENESRKRISEMISKTNLENESRKQTRK